MITIFCLDGVLMLGTSLQGENQKNLNDIRIGDTALAIWPASSSKS